MGLLRFFLALDVLLVHCGINTMGTNWAVEGFYIISGFYMSLVLNEKYIGKNSYKHFITNRFLRLLPTYWTIAIMSLILSLNCNVNINNDAIFSFEKTCPNTSIFSWAIATITNIIGIGQDWTLFMGVNAQTGSIFLTKSSFIESFPLCRYLLVPQAWSIGLELFFYLICPFFLRKKNKTIIALFIISVMIKIIIKKVLLLDDGNWTFRFFPSELMFFLIGYFSYTIYKKYQDKLQFKISYTFPFITIAILFLLWFAPLIYSLKYLLFIIIMAMSVPVLFSNYKRNKIDRIIGELSYPMYISYSLVIMIVSCISLKTSENALIISLSTIILSTILYFMIIRKLEVYKKNE